MQIDIKTYRDKVSACWIGKNIGGTMGTPYEGCRELLDIKGFVTKPNEVLPNDDLDLQLVWLYALEQSGPHAVDAALLGEYWLSYITPHWNEYGIGKANMKRGIRPPMSGDYDNSWRNSNGAWIRTEIWASVAPGAPEIAAYYAAEDAKVDHGAGEGTIAAIFVAAMQSAAYIVSDVRKCIEIGLAAIPETSRVAGSVRLVLEYYDSGKCWTDARNAVLAQNADIGNGWFESPSNVAYTVLGLIYGEGDFKKSMILAINCGDDTDCTGATVGATLGIIGGMSAIPTDWKEYIGDDIVTISISMGGAIRTYIPKTCTELAARVERLAPHVLFAKKSVVSLGDGDDLPEDIYGTMLSLVKEKVLPMVEALRPYSMHFTSTLFSADVTLDREPSIEPGGEIGVHLVFTLNEWPLENQPRTLSLRWILPEGFTVEGSQNLFLKHRSAHTPVASRDMHVKIHAPETVAARNIILLEVTDDARFTPLYIHFPLLG